MFEKPLLSMATGTAASLLAYFIIAAFTSLSYISIAAICLSALSLYLLFILLSYRSAVTKLKATYHGGSIESTGITEIYQDKKPGLIDYLREANHAFYFWGISAKRTSSSPELQQKLIELGRKKGDIRFLLFNPNSPNLKRKADDEGDHWQSWEKEIAATIERLKTISSMNNISIQIRVFDEFPIWRMNILDSRRIYLNYFLTGRQGPQSPLFVIDDKADSIFWPLFNEFKEVWETRSTPA